MHSDHTLYLYVFYVSQNVQRLLLYTVIMDRLFITELESVSCAVRNKFICTCVFRRHGSMYCSLC